jgi:hypothetical protein
MLYVASYRWKLFEKQLLVVVDSEVSAKQDKIFFENFDHTQIFSRLQSEPADINYNEKIYQDQLISIQIMEFLVG